MSDWLTRHRQHLGLLFTLAIGIVMTAMVVTAFGYGREPRTAPLVFGIPTAVLIGVQVVRDGVNIFRRSPTSDDTPAKDDSKGSAPSGSEGASLAAVQAKDDDVVGEQAMQTGSSDRRTTAPRGFAWVLGLAVLIWLVGMLYAIPIFTVVFMLTFGRERLRTALIHAAVTTLVVYLFFTVVLEVRLYRGQLGGLLS